MENYKIKVLDAKKDSDLLFKIVEHENEVFGEATVGNWNIKPFAKYGKVFVAMTDDEKEELISVIEVLSSFDKELAYIYGVSTVPKFEKKGYATKLLEYTIQYLKKIGIKKFELTVDIDNFAAQKIYKKLNFKIVENLENGITDQILLGVTGSGKTFTVANVIEKINRPALIMAPNKTLAAQLYNEYKNFFPENAVEYFVSYYDYYQPEAYIMATDTYIEKDSSINDEIDKMRHAATAALLNRRDVIIVASVSAIYGLGSPEAYKEKSIPIDVETGIERDELIKRLISLRYERNDISFERSKFRVKGDILDLYPSYQDTAYRFEFFGDDLESIFEIHPLTGQKIREVKRLTIMPATHYLTTEDTQKMFLEIKKEMEDRVHKFRAENKLIEAQRIEQRTKYDLEMIEEIGYCKGIENYSRYLTGKNAGEELQEQ